MHEQLKYLSTKIIFTYYIWFEPTNRLRTTNVCRLREAFTRDSVWFTDVISIGGTKETYFKSSQSEQYMERYTKWRWSLPWLMAWIANVTLFVTSYFLSRSMDRPKKPHRTPHSGVKAEKKGKKSKKSGFNEKVRLFQFQYPPQKE